MRRGGNNKGFTLIEIMIAVFLLGTAILAAAAVTTTVIKGNVFSEKLTTATTLAKDKIEALKIASFSSLSDGSDGWDAAGTASGTYYTRTWTVTGTDPKQITVTVTRPGGADVVLRTIRASD